MLYSITEWFDSVKRGSVHSYSTQGFISYNRVSQDHQKLDGNLVNQTRFMARVCQGYGLPIVKTISVVESGRTLQRQGLQSTIALAHSSKSIIVAFSLL